ncbi:MAG: hypothetical protein NVS3B21_09540 [Acidimicrobiales bacterium]
MGMLVGKRSCPCGTGRPARDCCGRFRRLSDAEIARSYLSRQARAARDLIGPFSPAALVTIQAEAAGLPARLPDVFAAALLSANVGVAGDVRRLAKAIQRADTVGASPAGVRTSRADSPVARAAVAKAMIALREAGTIDEHVTAASLVELSAGRSALMEAALFQAANDLATAGLQVGPAPAAWKMTAPQPL